MVGAVRRYALANYEKDGWDFVIESWSDEDIQKIVGTYTTQEAAIVAVHQVVKQLNSKRRDIEHA